MGGAKRMWTGVLALLMAVGLAACDAAGGGMLTAPDDAMEGRYPDSAGGYTVVTESDPSVGRVTGWICADGGKLVLGRHELRVPAGAISGCAEFAMAKVDERMAFRMTASDKKPNDVGSAGFAVPVTLVMDFSHGNGISDAKKLQVLWARKDGVLEPMPTTVDTSNKKVFGTLGHFSDYLLAMP